MFQAVTTNCQRRDSTDGRAAALNPADLGSNPVVSMLQRALRLSVSAGRQTQLIMNRSWSQTLIVALLHWLDYKTLQLLIEVQIKNEYKYVFYVLKINTKQFKSTEKVFQESEKFGLRRDSNPGYDDNLSKKASKHIKQLQNKCL